MEIIRIRDEHPGSATLDVRCNTSQNLKVKRNNKAVLNKKNLLFTKNARVFGMFVQRTALGEFFPASADVVPFAGVDGHVLAQIPLVLESFATQLAHKPCPLIHTPLAGNKAGVSIILEKI
jgi:hypothetical protein